MAIPVDSKDASERRRAPDRRRHSLKTLTYCGLARRGRRRTARRDEQNYYLDRFHPLLVASGLVILLLSCLDAIFTLMLLSRGAYEANQLMAMLLEIDQTLFVVVKVAITGVCVTFLVMHANFSILRFASGRSVLKWLMALYGLLIVYELVLLRAVT